MLHDFRADMPAVAVGENDLGISNQTNQNARQKPSQREFQSNQVPEVVWQRGLVLPVLDDIVDDDAGYDEGCEGNQRHQHSAGQARDDDIWRRFPYHAQHRRHVLERGDAFTPPWRRVLDLGFRWNLGRKSLCG